MPRFAFILILLATFALADETSFSRIQVPDAKGRQTKADLVFSDDHKSIDIRPVKGTPVRIAFAAIDKFSYEFTKRHRINEGTVFTAPVGAGAVMMLTKSKSHWLEIDYHEGNIPKTYVVRMDKRNYISILEAVKTHTGKDAEVLGNANKR